MSLFPGLVGLKKRHAATRVPDDIDSYGDKKTDSSTIDYVQINLNKKKWGVNEVLEILARCGMTCSASNMSDVESYRINYKRKK